jgi:DNA polymerase-3 subunit delta
LDYSALLREVERRQIPPVVLLHGPESLLRDDVVALVSRALAPDPSMAALDREVVDGREVSPEAIVRSASTVPFMAARRLVIVTRAEALPARGNESLVAYLRAPSDAACLLLVADQSLRPGRDRKADHWLLGAVPAGAVVEVTRPRDMRRALRQRAAHEGLDVGEEAAALLVMLVGEDLALLLGEARKAALAAGPTARRVTAADVRAVVGEQRVDQLFDLTRSVETGDRATALRRLDRLLGAGEDPLRILWFLVSDLRTLGTIRELARQGQTSEQIARRFRRPVPVIERMLARATGATPADLAGRLRRCWDVEARLKGSGHARAEMTVLVTDLC